MAKVLKSILLKGISGKIGDALVIRQCNGRTIVCKYPDRRRTEPTKNQKKVNEKFKKAVKYAQEVMKNDDLKKEYENKLNKAKKSRSLFHYIVGEYLKTS